MSEAIFVVDVQRRLETAENVQEVLTQYGCVINVRLGLHENREDCEKRGLILLHLEGEELGIQRLFDVLNTIDHVQVEKIKLPLSN